MVIKMIVCTDLYGWIGNKGKLLYHIPEDLKRFKEITESNIIVMGRKTLESLPQQYLPHRVNVVLTSDKNYKPKNSSVIVMHSIEQILNHYNSGTQDKDLIVIGGEFLYANFYKHTDIVHLTLVEDEADEYDTSFVCLDVLEREVDFLEVSCEEKQYNDLNYKFIDFVSKKKLISSWDEKERLHGDN